MQVRDQLCILKQVNKFGLPLTVFAHLYSRSPLSTLQRRNGNRPAAMTLALDKVRCQQLSPLRGICTSTFPCYASRVIEIAYRSDLPIYFSTLLLPLVTPVDDAGIDLGTRVAAGEVYLGRYLSQHRVLAV